MSGYPKINGKSGMTERTPITVDWSTDIRAIPKGKWVNENRPITSGKKKGELTTVKVWHSDKLWMTCAPEGTPLVTKTYWVPTENRWCGFTKNCDPKIIAWADYREINRKELNEAMPLPYRGFA